MTDQASPVGVDNARGVAIVSVETNPVTNRTKLVWWVGVQWPTNACLVQLLAGDALIAQVTVASRTYELELPWPVPAGTIASLRVEVVVPSQPVPISAPVAFVGAPTGVIARFDGAAVTVSWEPVAAAVLAYRVVMLSSSGTTILGETLDAQLVVPATTVDADATVTVQCLTELGSGPCAEAVALNELAWHLGAAPYVAPQRNAALEAFDIQLLLPDLFGGASAPMPEPDPLLQFSVTSTAGGPFPYQLTIPSTSPVWTLDRPFRDDIVTAWVAYLRALEGAKVTPLGVAAIQEAVARAMPQTFAETLFFAYGARFDRGYIDLRPGMSLRVEYETYQSINPALGDGLSGFITAGAADYEVVGPVDGPNPFVALDAFLRALTAAKGVTVTPPKPPDDKRAYGGGGVLDAFFPQFHQPFCRLVYPPKVLANNEAGSLNTWRNPILVAAPSVAALEDATALLRNSSPAPAVATVYMRGRAVFRAAVGVRVNGQSRLVAIGTTVGDVLAAEGVRPPRSASQLGQVRLRRARGAAVLAGSGASVVNAGAEWEVRLDWSPGDAAWLDLPLLHGDVLDWGTTGQ